MVVSAQMESLAQGLAGALGAAIGCYVVAPLGLIVTVKTSAASAAKQSSSVANTSTQGSDQPAAPPQPPPQSLSALAILAERIRSDGPLGLWRGEWLNAFGNFQSKFGFFFCYSLLAGMFVKRWGRMSKLTNLLVGYVAKLLPLPIVYPTSVLTNRMQTAAEPIGIRGALQQVLQTAGVAGLWRGAESYFVLAWWPALEIAIFEQFKAALLQARVAATEISGGEAFLLGALGRLIATSLVFPFIRTRSLAQKGVYPSVTAALKGMYSDGGLRSFYVGITPELVRGVSYNAVIMSIKELTVAFSRRILVLAAGAAVGGRL